MKKKESTKNITLSLESGAFTGIFKRFRGQKREYGFSDISVLRKLLSKERARILYTLKHKNPPSIYQLAKLVGRDFKSVREDVKLLEKFGFLELESATKGRREMLKPTLVVDKVNISIDI